VLKQDVAVLKQDVAVLKQDVAQIKDEMKHMNRKIDRMTALMEDFNKKLTVALELLEHCVGMIPAVHRHDLQIKDTGEDLTLTQKSLFNHIKNKEIHVAPKRGRRKKTNGNEGTL
jgi:predicted  nucleic acid-binding Zn-ribbon protein